MKRIVTIVLPIIEKDAAESGTSVREPTDGAVLNLASSAAGATKVEVVVSDDEAGRILSMVLGGLRSPEKEQEEEIDPEEEQNEIEQLVRHELNSADPAAVNLLDQIMERIERVLIQQVYSECHHVKSRAAIRLGINRNTLLKKLRRFGVLTEEDHAAALQAHS